MSLFDDKATVAAFNDELVQIEMSKQAFVGGVVRGFKQLGTLAKGVSSTAGRKSIWGGLKGVSEQAGGGVRGAWEAGKKLAPAAGAAVGTGLAAYGAKKAVFD